jgi:hypothetical protein
MHVLFHSPELKAIEKDVEVVLKFPEAEALSPPILQINEVSFGYSPDRMIFSNVNLGATLESRICIVSSFFFIYVYNFSIIVGMKLTTRLPLVLRSRKVELYLHFPIRVHGINFAFFILSIHP